jgi:hypothetical protein
VSVRPQWCYVQARLHARHGERLQETDWRALEAARSIDQFIERARISSLRRFTEHLNPRMSSHVVERMLRAAWRTYVAEIAAWVPEEWRASVLWTANLPALPVIDALRKGEAPDWAKQDPAFAEFIDGDPRRRAINLARSQCAPLLAADAGETMIAAGWAAHWRALWPKRGTNESRPLLDLAAMIKAHVERLDRAAPQDTSARYRGDLAIGLTRIFRRYSGTPVAVFSHLALVALDVERLRGGLVRRRLFEQGHAEQAA